jgi:hypothetical protein
VEVTESGENAQAEAQAGSCEVEGGTGSLAIEDAIAKDPDANRFSSRWR